MATTPGRSLTTLEFVKITMAGKKTWTLAPGGTNTVPFCHVLKRSRATKAQSRSLNRSLTPQFLLARGSRGSWLPADIHNVKTDALTMQA
jgi:hypothetical protein